MYVSGIIDGPISGDKLDLTVFWTVFGIFMLLFLLHYVAKYYCYFNTEEEITITFSNENLNKVKTYEHCCCQNIKTTSRENEMLINVRNLC